VNAGCSAQLASFFRAARLWWVRLVVMRAHRVNAGCSAEWLRFFELRGCGGFVWS